MTINIQCQRIPTVNDANGTDQNGYFIHRPDNYVIGMHQALKYNSLQSNYKLINQVIGILRVLPQPAVNFYTAKKTFFSDSPEIRLHSIYESHSFFYYSPASVTISKKVVYYEISIPSWQLAIIISHYSRLVILKGGI